MLKNIVDVDWEAMKVSLTMPTGAIILFDFAAAFPSVSHESPSLAFATSQIAGKLQSLKPLSTLNL